MEAWKKTCVTGLSTKYRQRGECCINIVSWELLVLEHFRIPLAPGQSAHSGEISFLFSPGGSTRGWFLCWSVWGRPWGFGAGVGGGEVGVSGRCQLHGQK